MRRRPFLRSLAGSALATATAGCLAALDPRRSRGSIGDRDATPLTDGTDAWPGCGFDPANTGYNPDASLLEADPTTRQLTRGGSGIDTSFGGGVAVGGDRFYFGTSAGDVFGYTTGGERLWRYEADPYAGVRSIPSLTREVVYVTSDNGTYALDAADGEELWTNDAWIRRGSSVLVDDRLYAIVGGPAVAAVDVETGAIEWTLEPSGGRPFVASLAVADGVVYTTGVSESDGELYALDGEETLWNRDDLGGLYTPPSVAGDFVVASTRGGDVYALDREDGGTVWRYRTGASSSVTPALAHGYAYLPGGATSTTCLDLESGDELWSIDTGRYGGPPVAVADGVYFGTPNRGLFAVDVDGTLRWHEEDVRTTGRMAAVGDRLYVVPFAGPFTSGDVHALEN